MTKVNKSWLDQYKENYEGKSAEANEVADYLKETYNGSSYIPWATMERLTYMQDPDAEFKKVRNEAGGLVHTDSFENNNLVEGKDGVVSKTSALVVSHFVKVSCVFMGKEFIEEYPIQEQDYSPAKIYNQNLVNKALQRALAKVASRATGIGLKLYEQKDLQFEEKEEEKKPEIKKTTKKTETHSETQNTVAATQKVNNETQNTVEEQAAKVEEPAVKEEKSSTNASYSNDVIELCKLIKTADKEKMTKVLQNLNVSILKQHGFTLNLEDDDNELCNKLTHFKDVTLFTKAIQNMLG